MQKQNYFHVFSKKLKKHDEIRRFSFFRSYLRHLIDQAPSVLFSIFSTRA